MTYTELGVRLESFRHLADDWDGEGSPAPNPTHVDAAIVVAKQLEVAGCVPPSSVMAGVRGGVAMESRWSGIAVVQQKTAGEWMEP